MPLRRTCALHLVLLALSRPRAASATVRGGGGNGVDGNGGGPNEAASVPGDGRGCRVTSGGVPDAPMWLAVLVLVASTRRRAH